MTVILGSNYPLCHTPLAPAFLRNARGKSECPASARPVPQHSTMAVGARQLSLVSLCLTSAF